MNPRARNLRSGRIALLVLACALAGCSSRQAVVHDESRPAAGIHNPVAERQENANGAEPVGRYGGTSESVSAAAFSTAQTAADRLCEPSHQPDTARSTVRRYVNVNVATLWATPQSPRSLDEPSLQFPADLPAWIGPMSLRDKLWLVGKTETEALYGEPVVLLEERGDWVRIAIPAQRTPQLAQGYPGWLPKRQLTEGAEATAYAGCPLAVVSRPTAWLYEDAALQKPALQLSFGTQLPVVSGGAGALQVATPADGVRWLAANDAIVRKPGAPAIPPTGEQIVELGSSFLGLPYLWAGTSGFGFDCSGFSYSLFRYFGIELPRDAKDQAKAGIAVDSRSLQPGDLLFFAYDKGKGTVHHVAIYAGDGKMLHSPKTERSVELIPFTTPEYAAEFAGARRVLPGRSSE